MEDYSEYLIQGEPDKYDRVRNWMAAIGLQDVDGLTPSNYMLEAVRRNIEGEITIDEVSRLVVYHSRRIKARGSYLRS